MGEGRTGGLIEERGSLVEASSSHVAMERAFDAANDRLALVAGQLNVANAELVAVAIDVIASGTWEQAGKRTPAAYLQWQAGLSPERAKDIVRVARRAADFPVLMGELRRGSLSLEQVVAAIDAPAWADEHVTEFAKIATVSKIRKAMRSEMFDGDPDEPDPDPAPVRDRLSFGVGRNGRWRISGELGLDDGRRIEAALTERRDAMFTAANDGASDVGESTVVVTWPEALVDCMERSLDAVESPTRRDRFRTWIHLDVTDGVATTTDGWRIPMSVRDRLLCDGVVQPVWESDGVPFSVGRAQHIVPERTRRIVERRDRGCRVPGCAAERFVEIHHIVHWADGGPTDTSNLISLCPWHHKLHHRGLLGISGNADRFDAVAFTDARGSPIEPTGTPSPPGEPIAPAAPYAPPTAHRFDWNWIGLGWVHPNAVRKRLDQVRAHHDRHAA